MRLLESRYDVAAADLEAALGPSIGACCYEVKEDVSGPLMKKWGRLTTPSVFVREGRTYLDLRRLNRDILRAAGIPGNQLHQIGPCTSCASEEFFSYRRAGGETGRQMSLIGWLP